MLWYAEVGTSRHQELLAEGERARRIAGARKARGRGRARGRASAPAFSPAEVTCHRAEGRLVERYAA